MQEDSPIITDQGQGQPPYLGVRFDAQRQPIRCSGNTVIAHLRGATLTAFARAQADLAASPGGDCFAWLPVPSLHMTIYDLLLHDRRGPGFWPPGLAENAPEDKTDAFVLDRLRSFDIGTTQPIQMRIDRLEVMNYGSTVILEPINLAANDHVRGIRDRVAKHLGLSDRPGHDDYVFHSTFAYLTKWLTEEEAGAIEQNRQTIEATLKQAVPMLELWPPEVCLFDDMCEFRPQFELG